MQWHQPYGIVGAATSMSTTSNDITGNGTGDAILVTENRQLAMATSKHHRNECNLNSGREQAAPSRVRDRHHFGDVRIDTTGAFVQGNGTNGFGVKGAVRAGVTSFVFPTTSPTTWPVRAASVLSVRGSLGLRRHRRGHGCGFKAIKVAVIATTGGTAR